MSNVGSDRPAVEDIIANLTTKSDRIRALANAGYERAEIAGILEIRYQHVRKVLIDAEAKSKQPAKPRAARGSPPDLAGVTSQLEPSPTVLTKAGFHLIGEWTPLSENAFQLSERAPLEPGVYAFVVDGVVRYIGLTQTGLHTRMGHYRRGHKGHRTSSRVKALILTCLAEGRPVQVLVATPGPLDWNGLPVSTAAGLEAALIRAMRPEWNMLGARISAFVKE
jgi:hypothetical protein